jgi:hypothetical protein
LVFKRAMGVTPKATSRAQDHLPASKLLAKVKSPDISSKMDECCGEACILDWILLKRAANVDLSEDLLSMAKDRIPCNTMSD